MFVKFDINHPDYCECFVMSLYPSRVIFFYNGKTVKSKEDKHTFNVKFSDCSVKPHSYSKLGIKKMRAKDTESGVRICFDSPITKFNIKNMFVFFSFNCFSIIKKCARQIETHNETRNYGDCQIRSHKQ